MYILKLCAVTPEWDLVRWWLASVRKEAYISWFLFNFKKGIKGTNLLGFVKYLKDNVDTGFINQHF